MKRSISRHRLATVLVAPIISAASLVLMAGTSAASTSWSYVGYIAQNPYAAHRCMDNAAEDPNIVQLWHCEGGGEQEWTRGVNNGSFWVDPAHVPGTLV